MINRVLIRIKVVQLLYSRLLTDTRFALESSPSAPTKEKRFAYNLYLSNLLFFIKLADRIKELHKNGSILTQSFFIKKIESQEEIKSYESSNIHRDLFFYGLTDYFAEKIIISKIYKDYIKNSVDDNQEHFWQDIYNLIIFPDESYQKAIAGLPNYTLGGVERMKELLNTTFTNFYNTKESFKDNIKLLESSLDKSRELYLRLLLLPIDITRVREQQIDESKYKYLATEDDLNPNLKFVENKFISELSSDSELEESAKKFNISWLSEDRELLLKLLQDIMNSEEYRIYMSSKTSDIKEDTEFWRKIYKNILFENEHFLEYMENKSIFWNDDLEIIGTFVLKTIRKYEETNGSGSRLLPMFKDGEEGSDAKFSKRLFSLVLDNREYYRSLIDNALEKDKWDSERLAFMDVVILMTAIAEIINFPEIPLTATYNEYIELAKSYSTNKSGSFINGLLKKIVADLQKDGIIIK